MKLSKLFLILIAFFLMLSSCHGNEPTPDDTEGGEQEQKPIIHIHSISDEKIENFVQVTCESDGSYDSVYYCTECDKELSRKTEIIKSEGHIPLDPVIEREVLDTCLTDGERVTVTYCSVCEGELSRIVEVLTSTGHTESTPEIIYDVDSICKTEGTRTKIVSCTRCHTELSRTTEVVAAVGHEWVDGKCEKCGVPYSVAESLDLTLSDDGTYYIITGIGNFSETELIIPSEYNGLPIKEIADHAFKDCTFIVRAVIPESIVRLGYGAAEGCTGLEELILEDRSGWSLYDGQEDPKIFPIPGILLIDTSKYFDLLLGGDQFALIKEEN